MGVSGNCRDCKHWDKGERRTVERPGMREAGWRHCGRITLDGDVGAHLDYDRDGADLVTAPDFGCMLFVAKEAT